MGALRARSGQISIPVPKPALAGKPKAAEQKKSTTNKAKWRNLIPAQQSTAQGNAVFPRIVGKTTSMDGNLTASEKAQLLITTSELFVGMASSDTRDRFHSIGVGRSKAFLVQEALAESISASGSPPSDEELVKISDSVTAP